MVENKTGLLEHFFIAIGKPNEYGKITKPGAGRVFLYLLILSLITSVLSLAVPVKDYFQSGGLTQIVEDFVPEFEISDGRISIDRCLEGAYDSYTLDSSGADSENSDQLSQEEQDLLLAHFAYTASKEWFSVRSGATSPEIMDPDSAVYYLLDTSYDTVAQAMEDRDVSKLCSDVTEVLVITGTELVLADSDDFLLAYGNRGTQEEKEAETSGSAVSQTSRAERKLAKNRLGYDTFLKKDTSMNKGDLMNLLKRLMPSLYAIVAFVFLLAACFRTLGWLFAGLIYSIIAKICSAGRNVPYGTLFKISVYAQTTTILLKALLSLTSVSQILLTYGGYVITIVYVVFATTKFNPNIESYADSGRA